MGLFFLKVAVNHKGGLIAYIQIVNCMTVSKQFVYTFEATGSYNASYTGPVRLYSHTYLYDIIFI